MRRDEFYILEALKEAGKAYRQGEVPVGALLVDSDGKILLRGHNECKRRKNPLAHAELLILQRAIELGINLEDATLYVTLEPCLMCASAVMLARLKRVVYGARNHLLGGIETIFNTATEPNFQHNIEIKGGLRAKVSEKLLRSFFTDLRRKRNGKEVYRASDDSGAF